MGRARLPLSEQKGDLTKERKAKLEAEQELVRTPKKYILKAPSWLSDRAKKEYRRLIKSMADMDMLGDLDANNLAGYCNAWDKYLQAEEEIKARGLFIESKKPGAPYQANPAIYVQIKHAKEMREFGRQCGLSIDSRLKFAAAKLPELEAEIEEEFGDI